MFLGLCGGIKSNMLMTSFFFTNLLIFRKYIDRTDEKLLYMDWIYEFSGCFIDTKFLDIHIYSILFYCQSHN